MAEATPVVGIIMGSESDMPAMEPCMAQLDAMGVPYEVKVASAHRKPAVVHEWAETAVERGIKVIIAASGVPVACVAINGAKNAAILAVQMMGTNDPAMLQKVADLKAAMAS